MASPNFDLGFCDFSIENKSKASNAARVTIDADDSAKPAPKPPRFASRTLQGVHSLIAGRVPASTKRATDQWVSVFQQFFCCLGHRCQLENRPSRGHFESSCLMLCEQREQNGTSLPTSKFDGLRAALNHYMSSLRTNLKIITDLAFCLGNDALDASLKEMKWSGERKQARPTQRSSSTD